MSDVTPRAPVRLLTQVKYTGVKACTVRRVMQGAGVISPLMRVDMPEAPETAPVAVAPAAELNLLDDREREVHVAALVTEHPVRPVGQPVQQTLGT